jgi:hypothetical protein
VGCFSASVFFVFFFFLTDLFFLAAELKDSSEELEDDDSDVLLSLEGDSDLFLFFGESLLFFSENSS